MNSLIGRVYNSVPAAMIVHDVISGNTKKWTMTKLFLISSTIAFALYLLVPVAGTTYFQNYNDLNATLLVDPNYISQQNGPRSAMPSLHATWGMFLIISSIDNLSKTIRGLFLSSLSIAYGIFTLLGALIFGDHYLLDVVVAVPFALSVYILLVCRQKMNRRQLTTSASFGILLTASWVIAIKTEARFGYPDYVVQLLTLATLAYAGVFVYSRIVPAAANGAKAATTCS